MLICPYCTNDVSEEQGGCCGESSAHFQEVPECPNCKELTNDLNPIIDGVCHYCNIIAEYEHSKNLSEAYRI